MKKKPITPIEKHANCQVEIRPSKHLMHYAYIYCLDCNKHIQWLPKNSALIADKLGMIKE